jgi:hypothetical protein
LEPVEALSHHLDGTVGRTRLGVVERHSPARCGHHLRDAGAHLTGADDEHVLEVHAA